MPFLFKNFMPHLTTRRLSTVTRKSSFSESRGRLDYEFCYCDSLRKKIEKPGKNSLVRTRFEVTAEDSGLSRCWVLSCLLVNKISSYRRFENSSVFERSETA
jgi:hypothetical protein